MEYDSDGTPIYDRAITSAPLRKLYKTLYSEGILPNVSTNLQVEPGEDMTVVVNPGFAICDGCLKYEESRRTLTAQASSSLYDRIDTVVLRLNNNDNVRACDFYIVKGIESTNPVAPPLTRNESVWELGLADLFITKNTTSISAQRITDTRYDKERCGALSPLGQLDLTTIYTQVQADLKEFQDVSYEEFAAWFEEMKGQLSEDAAGNLQLQVDEVKEQVATISAETTETKQEVADVSKMISDQYDPTKAYKVGDYCIQNNTLQKRIVDIEEPEAFNAEHWQQTSVDKELVELNSNLTWKKIGTSENKVPIEIPSGYNELLIFVKEPNEWQVGLKVPTIHLTPNVQYFQGGSSYMVATLYITSTSVTPNTVFYNDQQLSSFTTTVYAR